MTARCADKSKQTQTATPPPKITWLSVELEVTLRRARLMLRLVTNWPFTVTIFNQTFKITQPPTLYEKSGKLPLGYPGVQGRCHGWTGMDTSTRLFPEGVSGIESLWSVLISFILYPQNLPPTWRGHPPQPNTYRQPHFVWPGDAPDGVYEVRICTAGVDQYSGYFHYVC